jgi:hypothetical protein
MHYTYIHYSYINTHIHTYIHTYIPSAANHCTAEVRLLLEWRGDATIRDRNGRTPHDIASAKRYNSVIKALELSSKCMDLEADSKRCVFVDTKRKM